MSLEFNELPGWIFAVTEVSAGVFIVKGRDTMGHMVEKAGTDPDAMLEECKGYAAQVIVETRSR